MTRGRDMTSKPREGERCAVAATALDELPDRLAGQRPEGFGAEFPGKDEQQQAARRPGEERILRITPLPVGSTLRQQSP